MRIEHLRFVKILNLTRAESKAIEEATRPVTPVELLELASQQPDTLVISKVDGEWPDEVIGILMDGCDQDWRWGRVLDALLEGQPE